MMPVGSKSIFMLSNQIFSNDTATGFQNTHAPRESSPWDHAEGTPVTIRLCWSFHPPQPASPSFPSRPYLSVEFPGHLGPVLLLHLSWHLVCSGHRRSQGPEGRGGQPPASPRATYPPRSWGRAYSQLEPTGQADGSGSGFPATPAVRQRGFSGTQAGKLCSRQEEILEYVKAVSELQQSLPWLHSQNHCICSKITLVAGAPLPERLGSCAVGEAQASVNI